MFEGVGAWDWVTISQLAVAAGTLALAVATVRMARAAGKQAEATAEIVQATHRQAAATVDMVKIAEGQLTATHRQLRATTHPNIAIDSAFPGAVDDSDGSIVVNIQNLGEGSARLTEATLTPRVRGPRLVGTFSDHVLHGNAQGAIYFTARDIPVDRDSWQLRLAYEGPSAGVQAQFRARIQYSGGDIVVRDAETLR